VENIRTILWLIMLQQGLCAFSWWVGGWRLGLSKKVSAHWMTAALSTAAGLAMILQRGEWPNFITMVVANLAIIFGFITMRRGIQIFLRIRPTDREHLVVFTIDALLLLTLVFVSERNVVAVLGASLPIAWTLLRSARETHRALEREGSTATARVVATPLALLGFLFLMRSIAGAVAPDFAARPLHEGNAFNGSVAMVFMLVGLVLNLVLALMVVGRLVSRLQHLSERDALTGLLNRRALAPLLQREALRLRRNDTAYALLMIDIDHFKAINDQHGHAVGDAALVKLSEVLRQSTREVDHIARLGGEEFCILLPNSDLEGAMRLAERVHAAVREACWDDLERSITVSVGVAVAHTADETPQAVLERADQALYRAKDSGRDRVVLAEPPVFALKRA
jgi:diguanylate cyclase (GGDEF)-like protein